MSTSGRLQHMGLMRFTGPDALSFLQGQLSNDTRRLEEGSPLLAAYSTPQGRVAALVHVLPHSSGAIAILPREILLPTLERLRKFVLRAKVSAQDVSEQYVVVGLHDPDGLRGAGLGTPDAASGYLEQDWNRHRPRELEIEPALGDRQYRRSGEAPTRRRPFGR